MKKILLIFTLLFSFSFLAYGLTVNKTILDAYFEIYYPENKAPYDYMYIYNRNKTNTITMYAPYISSANKNQADVKIQIFTGIILDNTVKEISFFNDDFIATFSASYVHINNLSVISVFDFDYKLFDDTSKIKTVKMFQNGNVQMMYNYKGKTYKYPIDNKTSSMVAKILNLGFKK
ncbi:hypothetical protein R4K55_06270 [Brachyspira alvinipulli]|uniref:hypothetical protein n=1 Tax=Brachyspira alvinipulli TaxID=84379 RepID=UPI0030070E96